MDKYITMKWSYRVKRLRVAIRYTWDMMGKISGIDTGLLIRISKGRVMPGITNIRRIRLMEEAYAEYIEEWEARGARLDEWGKMEKVYEKYGGDLYYRRLLPCYKPVANLPRKQVYIDALGGMEAFDRVLRTCFKGMRKHGRKYRGGVSDDTQGDTV